MEAVLTELLKQGPVGAIAVTFIILYLKKDAENKELHAELRKESAARVSDAVAVREGMLAIQERSITSTMKVADVFDAAMKILPGGSR